MRLTMTKDIKRAQTSQEHQFQLLARIITILISYVKGFVQIR